MTQFPQPVYYFTQQSANYTAVPGDNVLVTTGTSTIVVTLPANPSKSTTVNVRKVDAAAGAIKLVTSDGSTINSVAGATGITTPTSQHSGWEVVSDGANWWVVGL